MSATASRALAIRLTLLIASFLSGWAALVYQTIWQRMLVLFVGADVYSVTIVISAFMTGLGVGHLAGGHLADRLSPGRRLLMFALAEGAVGAFALGSSWLLYDGLYGVLGGAGLTRVTVGALTFAVTLWPTFFMGMSLPLLARMLTDDPAEPAGWVPTLYAVNTLGAAMGALVTVAILLRIFDFTSILRLGAAASFSCVLCSLVLVGRQAVLEDVTERAPTFRPAAVGTLGNEPSLSFAAWLIIYALSGFVALSLEIVWFRTLGVVVLQSDASTFGYLLAIFLAGLAGGTLLGDLRVVRRWSPAGAFLLLQAAIPAWAGLSMAVLAYSAGKGEWLQPLWRYLDGTQGVSRSEAGALLVLVRYGLLPALLILPSTLTMGASFAVLQRVTQTDLGRVGRRLGWLQAANIAGSAAGALATGLWLLSWFGTAGTTRVMIACGMVFLGCFWVCAPERRGRAGIAALALSSVIWIVPGNDALWARLHIADFDQTIVGEDASGLVLLRPDAADGGTSVMIGGLRQSWLPYGGTHTALGALPALIHPSPKAIAIIGLASGDTVFTAGGREATETIDSIEIVRAQFDALQQLDAEHRYPALTMLLNDGRIRFRFTDGRAYLRQTEQRYDIIEADALLPTKVGAGNLYSVEYFELLRDRLAPGGFAVTWTPTARTRTSFLAVFPHVLFFRTMGIGSLEPIAYDREVVLARLRDPFTKAYYDAGGVDALKALQSSLSEQPTVYGPAFDRSALTDVNRDLAPRDEFSWVGDRLAAMLRAGPAASR